MSTTLSRLRRHIDEIDLKLLRLLNRRSALGIRIGEIKRKQALPVFDGRREERLLRRLSKANRGSLSGAALRAIFREILRHNRKLQK